MEETLKQLMEMIQDMKKGQEDMKKGQEDMRTELSVMKNGQEDMKKGQEDMKKGQEEMKTEMKINQEDMMTTLKTEMKITQSQLEERFQENMSELKETMQNRFKDFEQTVEEEITQMKNDIGNQVQVIEEKVHTVEETMKKDAKRIEDLEIKFAQLSTSSAIKVDGGITSSTRIQPPTFDGKLSWSTYLRQFEAAAAANNWSNEEKARSLILALRGEAVEVLRTISEDRQQDFTALSTALEMRYGELHLQHVYQAQLKGRRQRYDESLQQYEADIARMVNLAYPTAPIDFKEQLAVSSFIDGIRDSEISQALRLGRHKNIAEALAQALEIEAAKQASRNSQGRLRQINMRRKDHNFDKNTDDLVKYVLDFVDNMKGSGRENANSSTFRRRPIRCWNCGAEGHLKNRCPKNAATNQDQGNAN